MGIRFYCPNGHKLNVKEKLAGKRGFCPHCGVKLLIPHKSTRTSSREERAQQAGLAAGGGGNPNDFDVFPDDQTAEIALFDQFGNSPPSVGQSSAHIGTQSTVADSVLTTAFDDPDVAWYVQLPDGQRFGPATLPIIRSWVKERRISPTMLVWREGWQDWLEAKLVFPETERLFQQSLSQKSKNTPISPPNRFDDQRLDTGGETQRVSALVIAMIAVTVAVLGGILYYVLKS
jgi:hypothetical protein